MKVIVSLSGGDVIDVDAPAGVEVEVRQYHKDFLDEAASVRDDDRTRDLYGCWYQTVIPGA